MPFDHYFVKHLPLSNKQRKLEDCLSDDRKDNQVAFYSVSESRFVGVIFTNNPTQNVQTAVCLQQNRLYGLILCVVKQQRQ